MDTPLYLCDGKACEHCSPECKHTQDINHARNFEKRDGGFWEKPNVIAFLKITSYLKQRDIDDIRKSVEAQLPSGVVVLPCYVEPIVASSDGSEHPVKFCYGGIDLANGPDQSGLQPAT